MLSNERFTYLYRLLEEIEQEMGVEIKRGPDKTYSNAEIAWLGVWCAYKQWPLKELREEMEKNGWPEPLKQNKSTRQIPAISTLSRRLRETKVQELLRVAIERLAKQARVVYIDGTLLPVGRYSTDLEARFGAAGTRFQRAYKMVHIVNRFGQVIDLEILLGDQPEIVATDPMISRLQKVGRSFKDIVADAAYDSEPLHEKINEAIKARLVAPVSHKGRKPSGKRRKPYKGSYRRRIRKFLATEEGKKLYQRRVRVERSAAWFKQRPHNLYALPAFIRRKINVQRWTLCHAVLRNLHINPGIGSN